jgi:hypothetical protein
MGKKNNDVCKVKHGYSPMGEIVGLIICLFINNNLHKWGIPFVDGAKWLIYLPFANTFAIINSIINVFSQTTSGRAKSFFKILGSILGAVAITYLLRYMPFDFALAGYGYVNTYFILALKVAMVGLGIAILVNFICLIIGETKSEEASE